jgi:hypothetical protein
LRILARADLPLQELRRLLVVLHLPLNPSGSHSPPLAASSSRVSEPDV